METDFVHISIGVIIFIFNIIFIIDTFLKPVQIFSRLHSRITYGYIDKKPIDWGNIQERKYCLYGLFFLNFLMIAGGDFEKWVIYSFLIVSGINLFVFIIFLVHKREFSKRDD